MTSRAPRNPLFPDAKAERGIAIAVALHAAYPHVDEPLGPHLKALLLRLEGGNDAAPSPTVFIG